MRLSAAVAVPLLLTLQGISASLATDAFAWANSLVSSEGDKSVQASKKGDVHVMDSWSYVDCGLATDAVQIRSISVSPDPPVPGKNLTVHVDADVLDTIEEGSSADVTVKLGLIKLLQKTFDVCEEASHATLDISFGTPSFYLTHRELPADLCSAFFRRGANATVQCPVQPGPYSVSQTVELPKEIPKAKFSVAVRGYTADDDDMLCLDLFVDFMKRPGGGN